MTWEQDLPKKPRTYELGADLSTFSVNELDEYSALLDEEKKRVQVMISVKKVSRNAADSVFKS